MPVHPRVQLGLVPIHPRIEFNLVPLHPREEFSLVPLHPPVEFGLVPVHPRVQLGLVSIHPRAKSRLVLICPRVLFVPVPIHPLHDRVKLAVNPAHDVLGQAHAHRHQGDHDSDQLLRANVGIHGSCLPRRRPLQSWQIRTLSSSPHGDRTTSAGFPCIPACQRISMVIAAGRIQAISSRLPVRFVGSVRPNELGVGMNPATGSPAPTGISPPAVRLACTVPSCAASAKPAPRPDQRKASNRPLFVRSRRAGRKRAWAASQCFLLARRRNLLPAAASYEVSVASAWALVRRDPDLSRSAPWPTRVLSGQRLRFAGRPPSRHASWNRNRIVPRFGWNPVKPDPGPGFGT